MKKDEHSLFVQIISYTGFVIATFLSFFLILCEIEESFFLNLLIGKLFTFILVKGTGFAILSGEIYCVMKYYHLDSISEFD